MNRYFFTVLVVLAVSSFFLFPGGVYAQDVASLQKEVDNLQSEVQKLQGQSNEYQFLKEQIKDFKDSVKTEMQDYRTFVEGEWSKFLGLLNIIGLIFLFVLGASWWEYRREIQKVKDKAITDFKNRTDEELKELFRKWDNKAKEKIKTLDELINREQGYKNAKILIMGSKKDLGLMEDFIIPAMDKRGIKNLTYQELPLGLRELQTDQIKQKSEDAEIIVYCYEPTEKELDEKQDFRMRTILQLLDKENDIPIIVYTHDKGDGKVKGNDYKVLNDYRWSLYANTPTTLLGHIFTYIHATREGRDERGTC